MEFSSGPNTSAGHKLKPHLVIRTSVSIVVLIPFSRYSTIAGLVIGILFDEVISTVWL